MLRSALDAVPGIGRTRKSLLLQRFGGLAGIRAASVEEISRLPGFNRPLAERVRAAALSAGGDPGLNTSTSPERP
jgi:excinuclease ABC subunit C